MQKLGGLQKSVVLTGNADGRGLPKTMVTGIREVPEVPVAAFAGRVSATLTDVRTYPSVFKWDGRTLRRHFDVREQNTENQSQRCWPVGARRGRCDNLGINISRCRKMQSVELSGPRSAWPLSM